MGVDGWFVGCFVLEGRKHTRGASRNGANLGEPGPCNQPAASHPTPCATLLLSLPSGLDPALTTRDIGILVGFYFGLVALSLLLFFLRLPRQRSMSGGSRTKRLARHGASLVRSASDRVVSASRNASERLASLKEGLPAVAEAHGKAAPALADAASPAAKAESGLRARVKKWGQWELSWGSRGGAATAGTAVSADATAAASQSQQGLPSPLQSGLQH